MALSPNVTVLIDARQVDGDTAALSCFGYNLNTAVVLFDRAVNHGQAEPGSLTGPFGREKRFEYLVANIRTDPLAAILYP